jgi:hypothetical protein
MSSSSRRLSSVSRTSRKIINTVINITENDSARENTLDEFWHSSVDLNLPTFFQLCNNVQKELNIIFTNYCFFSIIALPISYVFAYSTIGHFFTKVGRQEWSRVRKRYLLFIQVCAGIWTERAAVAYGNCDKHHYFSYHNVVNL